MKKVIISSAFALALMLGAGYTYNATDDSLSELQLLNAEALAEVEVNSSPSNPCPTSGDGCYVSGSGWFPFDAESRW